MTYEEAIKEIKHRMLETIETEYDWMAIESLEKRIPKKPLNKVSRELLLPEEKCVECGTILFISDRYCPYCGQAIDWSETE